MALAARLVRPKPQLFRQCRILSLPQPSRTYISTSTPLSSLQNSSFKTCHRQTRAFSRIAAHLNRTTEAPNAQAYLNSGAIAGGRDLVDVKKALVIGSGGLSIGQAGEFDYSGER